MDGSERALAELSDLVHTLLSGFGREGNNQPLRLTQKAWQDAKRTVVVETMDREKAGDNPRLDTYVEDRRALCSRYVQN